MQILYCHQSQTQNLVKDECELLNAATIIHAANLHTMHYLHQFTLLMPALQNLNQSDSGLQRLR